jgi:hypothetical protein
MGLTLESEIGTQSPNPSLIPPICGQAFVKLARATNLFPVKKKRAANGGPNLVRVSRDSQGRTDLKLLGQRGWRTASNSIISKSAPVKKNISKVALLLFQ